MVALTNEVVNKSDEWMIRDIDIYLLGLLCPDYVSCDPATNGCTLYDSCPRMHICPQWLMGECSSNSGRSINDRTKRCFKSHWVSMRERVKVKQWGYDPKDEHFWRILSNTLKEGFKQDQEKETHKANQNDLANIQNDVVNTENEIDSIGNDVDNIGNDVDNIQNNIAKQSSRAQVKVPVCPYFLNQCCESGNKCGLIHICANWLSSLCNRTKCIFNHFLLAKDESILRANGFVGETRELIKQYKDNIGTEQKWTSLDSQVSVDKRCSRRNRKRVRLVDFNSKNSTALEKEEKVTKGTNPTWKYRKLPGMGTSGENDYETEDWQSFEDRQNRRLENAFCDVNLDSCAVLDRQKKRLTLNFDTMTSDDYTVEVKRFSDSDVWKWFIHFNNDSECDVCFSSDSQCVTENSDFIDQFYRKVLTNLSQCEEIPFTIGEENFKLFIHSANNNPGPPEIYATDQSQNTLKIRRRPKASIGSVEIFSDYEECEVAKKFVGKSGCVSEDCPMSVFNVKGAEFLWVWKDKKSETWRRFDSSQQSRLEHMFSCPSCTYITILVDRNLELQITADNLCNFTVTYPSGFLMKRLQHSSECSDINNNRSEVNFTWYWQRPLSFRDKNAYTFLEPTELISLLNCYNESDIRWTDMNLNGIQGVSSITGSEVETYFHLFRSEEALEFTVSENSLKDVEVLDEVSEKVQVLDLSDDCHLSGYKLRRRQCKRKTRNCSLGDKLERALNLCNIQGHNSSANFLPLVWEPCINISHNRFVQLTNEDIDYSFIRDYCKRVFSHAASVEITRIESMKLWCEYCEMKQEMSDKKIKEEKRSKLNEMVLFYPCSKPLYAKKLNYLMQHNISRSFPNRDRIKSI